MTIRKTKSVDISPIADIYKEARGTINQLGINQWQHGYPSEEVLCDDRRLSRSYAVLDDSETVCGTFALLDDGEPSYDVICDGEWKTGNDNKNYAALHRVAIAVSHRGTGVSTEIVKFAADFAKENGMTSVRIDTHPGNVVMRKMLENHGFQYCGIIHLIEGEDAGDARVAYELLI